MIYLPRQCGIYTISGTRKTSFPTAVKAELSQFPVWITRGTPRTQVGAVVASIDRSIFQVSYHGALCNRIMSVLSYDTLLYDTKMQVKQTTVVDNNIPNDTRRPPTNESHRECCTTTYCCICITPTSSKHPKDTRQDTALLL